MDSNVTMTMNTDVSTKGVAALLVRLECLEELELLDGNGNAALSSYSGLELFDGLERDNDNEHRRLDSTKGVAALLVCLDRLERLDGLGCLAQLL